MPSSSTTTNDIAAGAEEFLLSKDVPVVKLQPGIPIAIDPQATGTTILRGGGPRTRGYQGNRDNYCYGCCTCTIM
jgi:hypothetical protein